MQNDHKSRIEAVAHEGFSSLLIPVDLTPGSDRVVGRAARLPLAEGAHFTLLHVVPKGLPARAERRAVSDAARSLQSEARNLARTVPKSVSVKHVVMAGTPAKEISKCAGSAKADLIVMGRGGGRAIRDLFLGSTAERVIRRGRLPVLVVRLPPRTDYLRPALALDLDQAALEAVALLLRVVPPPRPRVAVIHAYDAPFRGMTYPSLAEDRAEEYLEHYRRQALRKVVKTLATGLAHAKVPPKDAPSWRTYLQYGSPRSVIEKTVRKTSRDLLVLGSHGYSGAAQAFLGTVAGDVLREVACDVLVVPPRRATRRAK